MAHDTHIDLQQTVAALRQQLEARRAERDETLARVEVADVRAAAETPQSRLSIRAGSRTIGSHADYDAII